jgi:hypothetical protein
MSVSGAAFKKLSSIVIDPTGTYMYALQNTTWRSLRRFSLTDRQPACRFVWPKYFTPDDMVHVEGGFTSLTSGVVTSLQLSLSSTSFGVVDSSLSSVTAAAVLSVSDEGHSVIASFSSIAIANSPAPVAALSGLTISNTYENGTTFDFGSITPVTG